MKNVKTTNKLVIKGFSRKVHDDNDPQNLVTKYNFINSDGTINNTAT